MDDSFLEMSARHKRSEALSEQIIDRLKAELDKARMQRDAMFHENAKLEEANLRHQRDNREFFELARKLRAAGEALAERARACLEWQKIPAPKRAHVEPLKDIMRDLAAWQVSGKERSDDN